MISTNHICTLTPQSQCYQEYNLPDHLTIQLPNHCVPDLKVLISAWCWRQIGHFRGRCTRAVVVHQHRGAFYVRGRQSGKCLGVNLKLVAIDPAVVCTSSPVYILYIYIHLQYILGMNCWILFFDYICMYIYLYICICITIILYIYIYVLASSYASSSFWRLLLLLLPLLSLLLSLSLSLTLSLDIEWMRLEICPPDKENQKDTPRTSPGTWEPLMMDMWFMMMFQRTSTSSF